MGLPTQKLRQEHEAFRQSIEVLKTTADETGSSPVDDLRDALEQSYLFLEESLLPHARAEDTVLYPAIAEIMGFERAMASMTLDHVEIGTLANELGILRLELIDEEQPAPEVLREIRRVLYGLHALIRAHMTKEETLYLPLLDAHLSEHEATRLFAMMDSVGRPSRFAIS